MRRIFILTIAFALVLAAAATGSDDPFAQAEEKQYVGSKFKLHQYAWLTRSTGNQKAPLIVLIHNRGETHEACAPVISALQDYVAADTTGRLVMPYTLSFDLRGHGKSLKLDRSFRTYEDMVKPHWMEIPEELAEMTTSIIADTTYNIDTSRICLVGSIIGANAAALMTDFIPSIERVVMVSPAKEFRGLFIPEALSNFTGEALIMLSSRDQLLLKNALEMIKNNREGSLDLKKYPMRGFGWDMFNTNPEAMPDLLEWLLR